MVTARESKAALTLVTTASVGAVVSLFNETYAQPEAQRTALLEAVPGAIEYYAYGAAALAADFYDDEREREAAPKLFIAEPVIADRVVNIRRAVAWASEPLFTDDTAGSVARLAEVVSLETARPYRDTVLTNRRRDPSAVGWRRITRGSKSCRFCRMLADRGAVYMDSTARFAAHPSCQCTAQPVFSSSDFGEEASVMQYMASKRKRSALQKEQLRNYLDEHFPEGRAKSYTPQTAKLKSAGLSAEDKQVRLRAQLSSLEKSLPNLRDRAAAGEDLSQAIKWQENRISVLRTELGK